MESKETKIINGHTHIKFKPTTLSIEQQLNASGKLYDKMSKRRSIRDYSKKQVPLEIIENIIKTAGSAPSGAHKQPWTFCLVRNKEIKRQIRKAAEAEEEKSYKDRMNETWLKDLEPLGTNSLKPFLETAPYLIIVFKHLFEYNENGEKQQNYYINESVGIACGMLITAIHNAGLVTLTHTPSPMRFLEKILERPDNERAFLLLPVGYPSEDSFVPRLTRKKLNDIVAYY